MFPHIGLLYATVRELSEAREVPKIGAELGKEVEEEFQKLESEMLKSSYMDYKRSLNVGVDDPLRDAGFNDRKTDAEFYSEMSFSRSPFDIDAKLPSRAFIPCEDTLITAYRLPRCYDSLPIYKEIDVKFPICFAPNSTDSSVGLTMTCGEGAMLGYYTNTGFVHSRQFTVVPSERYHWPSRGKHCVLYGEDPLSSLAITYRNSREIRARSYIVVRDEFIGGLCGWKLGVSISVVKGVVTYEARDTGTRYTGAKIDIYPRGPEWWEKYRPAISVSANTTLHAVFRVTHVKNCEMGSDNGFPDDAGPVRCCSRVRRWAHLINAVDDSVIRRIDPGWWRIVEWCPLPMSRVFLGLFIHEGVVSLRTLRDKVSFGERYKVGKSKALFRSLPVLAIKVLGLPAMFSDDPGVSSDELAHMGGLMINALVTEVIEDNVLSAVQIFAGHDHGDETVEELLSHGACFSGAFSCRCVAALGVIDSEIDTSATILAHYFDPVLCSLGMEWDNFPSLLAGWISSKGKQWLCAVCGVGDADFMEQYYQCSCRPTGKYKCVAFTRKPRLLVGVDELTTSRLCRDFAITFNVRHHDVDALNVAVDKLGLK